jgi:hypothetical protein
MSPLRNWRRPTLLPFVALLAAWFCSNSPQSVTINLVEWAKNARHFSHQQQLRTEVASLLAGRRSVRTVTAAGSSPKAPPSVPISEGALIKKIDLSVSQNVVGLLPSLESHPFEAGLGGPPKSERAEPAILPPRAGEEA